MCGSHLKEIKSRLATLPVLEQRLQKVGSALSKAQDELNCQKRKYEAEAKDVEKLSEESFTATLLRFVGRYEGKLTKEKQEELLAKVEYDKAQEAVRSLLRQRNELSARVTELRNEREQYNTELERRREEIKRGISGEAFAKYRELELELDAQTRLIAEIDEAIRAAGRAAVTAEHAISNLNTAEGWATYDVFAKGGILNHIAKYDSLDEAQSAFELLESQLEDLQREMGDVNLKSGIEFIPLDSSTRAIDFWFDNIFTDLSVRSIIQENQQQLITLREKLSELASTLERKKTEIFQVIGRLEEDMEQILISY